MLWIRQPNSDPYESGSAILFQLQFLLKRVLMTNEVVVVYVSQLRTDFMRSALLSLEHSMHWMQGHQCGDNEIRTQAVRPKCKESLTTRPLVASLILVIQADFSANPRISATCSAGIPFVLSEHCTIQYNFCTSVLCAALLPGLTPRLLANLRKNVCKI